MIEGAPGRFVGDRYHIVRELGRGGMGVVYLGRDLRLDMDVAIKFRGVVHSDATLWLKREFRSVASLRHPNLVELYELVAHDQSCYFTMEYLPGMDPRRWVERRQLSSAPPFDPLGTDQTTASVVPLQEARTEMSASAIQAAAAAVALPRPVAQVDFARIRSVLVQLAEGIAFLHARGVIHRDVKPSNTIVVDGAVKLLDFGLALERRRQEQDLERETRIVGTAAYLAPEYVERLVISPQMDVYALGVLAYELCTGAPPFGGTMHVLSRLKKNIVAPRASETNPDIPTDLDALLAAMLSADPARRPTALEVAQRLSGSQSQHRAARRELSFIGREDELERLGARLEDSAPHGRLVLVTGPSGVGKTALIDEAVGHARSAELLVWRGRCHERERVPYRAFDSIIDDLATELSGDARLAKEIGYAAALTRVFPVLAPLIDPVRRDEPPAADLRVERERALLALTQMVRSLMTAPRGVVVIDDLQWADDDSLELLALLVEKIERPLTIVASWTTQGAAPPREALLERLGKAAEVMDVPAMTEAEALRVVAELAPRAPTERIVAAARLAAGSPYLAELIGRELGEADVTDPHDAELRRLDRLTPPERAVAQITALAGGTASFEQLRALAELPSAKLQSVLRGLEDAKVVRAAPAVSGEPVYVFYHQRLREIAHDAMGAEARSALHGRFATWFEDTTNDPGQLAYHWQQAGNPTRAAHWAIVAGDAAQAQLAWGIASDWYARAIDLGTSSVRGKLAECLFLGGKLAAAAEEFLRLAESEGNGDRWSVRAAEAYLKL
ncbi:MAG: protein kinase, partial [Deltaproteobacteria bacterium]|nr:protein kinase [Deltaproteobacteria bacterium]